MLQCVAEKFPCLPFSKPGAAVLSSERCMGRRTVLTKYRQTTIQIRQKPALNRWTMSCLDVVGGIHARLQSKRNPSPLSSPLYEGERRHAACATRTFLPTANVTATLFLW